jgi:hypothetical protein
MPSFAAEILYVGPDHVVALYRAVLFMVIQDDPRPGVLQHQARWLRKLKAESPDGAGYIVVLRSDVPPPKDAARQDIKKVLVDFGTVVSAGCLVVEGTGFAAATIRSVLSLMNLASRYTYKMKVFSTVSEACYWLPSQISKGKRAVEPLDLLAAIEEIKKVYRDGQLQAD